MIDVAALASDLGLEPAAVTWLIYPEASDGDALGEVDTGTPDEHDEVIVVHPTGRRTVERLGLDKRRETISLYTTRADIDALAAAPTRVVYQGSTYEAAAVGDYTRMGGIVLVHAQLLDAVAT